MNTRLEQRILRTSLLALACSTLGACVGVDISGWEEDFGSGITMPPPEPAPSASPATIAAVTAPGTGANTDRLEWSPELDDEDADISGTQTLRLVQYASEVNLGVPAFVGPENLANRSGASLIVELPADPDEEVSFALSIPSGDLPDPIPLAIDPSGQLLTATLADGRTVRVVLDTENRSSTAGGEELQWTAYGAWNVSASAGGTAYGADFVTGAETPDAAMPTSGTATFAGFVQGSVTMGDGPSLRVASLRGDATITADFASGTISGGAPTIIAIPLGQLPPGPGPVTPGPSQPWNSLLFAGTFAQGMNGFSGTTRTDNAPGNTYSLGEGATGSFSGLFYGPGASELGAVWNMQDASGMAAGILVGRQ